MNSSTLRHGGGAALTVAVAAVVAVSLVGSSKAAAQRPAPITGARVVAMVSPINSAAVTPHAVVTAACSASQCVTPGAPVAGCADGTPSLLMLGTEGIDYTTSADAPYADGQQITITATSAAGRFAPTSPVGWTRVGPSIETYAITFATC
jgi:hypothetical protein